MAWDWHNESKSRTSALTRHTSLEKNLGKLTKKGNKWIHRIVSVCTVPSRSFHLKLFLAKRYLLFYLAILPVSRQTWATKSASRNSLQHHYRRSRSRVVPAINRKRQQKKKGFVGETVFSTCAQPRKCIDDWIDNWTVCDSLLPVEWASIIPIKETPDLSALCILVNRDNREETRASEVNSIDG